jgi:hypothetical protein
MSDFKGVCFDKARGKFKAQITINATKVNLGLFDTEYEAARAYIEAAEGKKVMSEKMKSAPAVVLTPFTGKYNVVSLTDIHYPFQDDMAVQAALDFVRDVQPQVVIVHECMDFYTLSRFSKDPNRKDDLQQEIDQVCGFFAVLRDACPKARIILVDSNHLARLRLYLASQATALASLRALEVPELFDLQKYNIEYVIDVIIKGVLFKHGSIVSQGAGASGLRELQKENMSGVSGHTHRGAVVYRQDRNGQLFWVESGCLCTTRPDYIPGIANWNSGFSIVSWDKESKVAIPKFIPIIDGKCRV